MTIQKAQKLLTLNYFALSLKQLQKHKIDLIDAWRHSRAEYGMDTAVKEGFYCSVASESAAGFVPVDLWLTQNLFTRYNEVFAQEQKLLSESLKQRRNTK